MGLFGSGPLALSSSRTIAEGALCERRLAFEFVVKQLQQALPLLSDANSNLSGPYYGRITRPVAMFLPAKLALNAEIYTDNDCTDGNRPDGKNIFFEVGGNRLNAWQTVIAYCDRLKEAGYRLEPDYKANFAVFNESSVEIGRAHV